MNTINKENAIPYYLQLADILRGKILSGEFESNELIPSEREFCDSYDVSRSTVRQTMQVLKEEGLIRKQRGVGTRVSPSSRIEQDLSGFHDFDLQMLEQGHHASMVILGQKTLTGPSRAQRLMNLDERENILQVDRLRMVDSAPVFIEKIYLPVSKFPNITEKDFTDTNLFLDKLKTDYGVTLGQVKVFLEPVLLDEAECEIMDITKTPSPGLLLERISHDKYNKPIAVTKRLFRGDLCRHMLMIKMK